MPAKLPHIADTTLTELQRLGALIRAQRKRLNISATVTAHAAGLSRVTLHRVEAGEPAVTMGAYVSVMDALGLSIALLPRNTRSDADSPDLTLPMRIRLADYPQLRKLAWHTPNLEDVSLREALDIYERHSNPADLAAMQGRDKQLYETLKRINMPHHV